MRRRDFLKATGAGFGALMLPYGRAIAAEELVARLDDGLRRSLAGAALEAARAAGAGYCDVRIGRYLRQFINTREDRVENIVNTESTGVGVRVLADGAWGFAATSSLTADAVAAASRQAVAIARANARIGGAKVELAPQRGVGEVSWRTPVERNPMEVPIGDKVDLLLSVNAAALRAGADFIASNLFQVNEQKYFASSDGSWIDQDVYRIWAPFTATAVDKASGRFRTRDGLSQPMGMGYEFLQPKPEHRVELPTGVVVYSDSYDMVADAVAAAKDAREKLKAPSVTPDKYDLVLDPSHLFLTIHESVGHPTELDRVLGYEANYAGTSFVTLDKVRDRFRYGSEHVNIVADRTQPRSLGAIGWDDEGVPAQRWDIIREGQLVNLQATRDQAHLLGLDHGQGCCYADSWGSVQFQRMPNVSLEPGRAPLSPAQLVADVEDGIYIVGRGSYSIDQQRYNAQFGGQLFHEIKGGKVTRMLGDVAYQMRTPEFWNACAAVCDRGDYRLGGSFFDGKGQPGQVSAVSHGTSTARFNGINVINTARSLG
ncbi:MAG TPA: TldD/PmbA family protein [Xanthomonadaceae bacterium]|nr:TldD/PmbA family protein [Xanthomonadaceae bacterium]